MNATSASRRRPTKVSATPTWLLYDIGVAATRRPDAARIATSMSFTVVLPLEPVTATTCPAKASRASDASACSAAIGSSTSMIAPR